VLVEISDIYYREAHTTIAAADSTHLLLADAVCRDMHVHQVDFEASLETSVFIGPFKINPSLKGVIWMGNKAVYAVYDCMKLGYHDSFSKDRVNCGFKPCMTDSCLLENTQGENSTVL
jgi:hypothetical protein